MAEPYPHTHTLMQAAARLRVAGHEWQAVAEALERSVDTCRHWPYDYPVVWRGYVLSAIDDALADYESEALLVCRANLRSTESRDRQRAAADLLRHARELRGTKRKVELSGPDGGAIQWAEFSIEELAKIANGDYSESEGGDCVPGD